jgi:PKD repeat protein
MMKKLSLIFLTAIGLLISCETNDEAPVFKACFDYSPLEDLKTGNEITFTNCSEEATHFFWFFGDGDTSDEENPKHTYLEEGKYKIILVAQNEPFFDVNADEILTTDDIMIGSDTISKEITIEK